MNDPSACGTQAETARGTRAVLDRRRLAGSLRPRLAGGFISRGYYSRTNICLPASRMPANR
jgi:hypothetical protein